MAWDVDGDSVDPAEAIAWFRARLPLTDSQFGSLSDEARARAFFVSGLTTLEAVQQVFDRLDSALAKGDTFEEFKAALPAALQNTWGGGSAHRLRLVFDTQLQSAYGAGRWKSADEVRESRPYWSLAVVLDGRTSKVCLNLRGVVLPADDPFWNTHIPPLHYRCRTALVTFSREQAEARGITSTLPLQPPLEGFGTPPGQQAWSPAEADYHPELWAAYQRLRQPDTGLTPESPQPVPVITNPVARVADVTTEQMFGEPRDISIPDRQRERLEGFLAQHADEISDTLRLSRNLSLEDVLKLTGAPNSSSLAVGAMGRSNSGIRISLEGDITDVDYAIKRTLFITRDEPPYIYNDYLLNNRSVRSDEYIQPPKGFGVRIFAHQVHKAQQLGFDHIHVQAARSDDKDYPMNGYITWPKLGYDAPLEGYWLDQIRPEFLRQAGRELPESVTTMQRLFAFREAVKLWEKTGYSKYMDFDLNPESIGWARLRAYLAANNYEIIEGW